MNKNKDKFFTTSLSLAAALQAVSLSKLIDIDYSNPKRAEFVFDKSADPQFDNIIKKFWNKSLPIDAYSYFDAQKLIKSRLYERNYEK